MSGKKKNVFYEIEYKLDASTLEQIKKVGQYVLTHPDHYTTAHKPLPAILKDFPGLGAAHVNTDWRKKIYFDDLDLSGHDHGIEIRVEENDDGTYAMTAKIGDNHPKSGAFRRYEYKVDKMVSMKPELQRLPKHVRSLLCETYTDERGHKARSVDDIRIFPLEVLHSQRLRVKYHPDGRPNSLIEYAHDAGRGQTCVGDTWEFFQAEPERKKGSANILQAEVRRLRDQFPFLKPCDKSKPAPGFEKLRQQFEDVAFRSFALKHLCVDKWVLLPPMPAG